ncbi:hypothetical protein [Nocardioides panacisoli]|uniref:DUF4386 family protein n=1 Tax=Nocardioides panacisoli TaxID=627624 RepID=A0ABP7HVC5_9ACTN
MTTHITTHNPARADLPATGPAPAATTTDRRWALAGIGAGLAGIGSIITTTMVDGVYDQDLVGHPDLIADKIADERGWMFAFHSISMLGALLMIVFAAGLFGRLKATVGVTTSTIVALAGLVGTAVVSVLGAGLDTEFMMSLSFDRDSVDDYNIAHYNHWIGTIPWLWVLAGLSGLALFAIARQGGVPRWIGRVGLVLGGLTALLGVSPLEYMSGVTGALLVLVTAIGFAAGDRVFRGTR